VPRALHMSLVTVLLVSAAGGLAAQSNQLPPSPTYPSDTLQANYGPKSAVGPTPELAPTLPSDTLQVTQPQDSGRADSLSGRSSSQASPDDGYPDFGPMSPADSAALRELKGWIRDHPGLSAPPPARAVLVRA